MQLHFFMQHLSKSRKSTKVYKNVDSIFARRAERPEKIPTVHVIAVNRDGATMNTL